MKDTSGVIRNFGSICMPNYSWFGGNYAGTKVYLNNLNRFNKLNNSNVWRVKGIVQRHYFNFEKKNRNRIKVKLIYLFKGWKFTKYKLIYYPFKIKVIYYLPNKSIAFINIQGRSMGQFIIQLADILIIY